ncbi:hypothetical protein HYDPIDRAFT_169753 [Hydnomerulius pinastri MD-312]|uniref:Uncharacterized protein n=1 Tax=Hydnomerulius pinastri MD-312 TaxID=994086 RepID=A0A0C9VTJ7_9AGAM|nr:hypothetical protein HYDPIDRAFT_169753 [Hydnomerulius pinastri MD-312]
MRKRGANLCGVPLVPIGCALISLKKFDCMGQATNTGGGLTSSSSDVGNHRIRVPALSDEKDGCSRRPGTPQKFILQTILRVSASRDKSSPPSDSIAAAEVSIRGGGTTDNESCMTSSMLPQTTTGETPSIVHTVNHIYLRSTLG